MSPMLRYFKVMMLGEGMDFKVPQGSIKGSYATRIVRAKDAKAASAKVQSLLCADLIVQRYLAVGDEESIVFTAESSESVGFFKSFARPQGFTFFLG